MQRILKEADKDRVEATPGVSRANSSPTTEAGKDEAGNIQHGVTKQSALINPADSHANNSYAHLRPGDEDLNWDSKIDESGHESSEDDEPLALFARDPWNAVCVLGLRVYSETEKVKLEVVKGKVTEGEKKDHGDVQEEAPAAEGEVTEGESGRKDHGDAKEEAPAAKAVL